MRWADKLRHEDVIAAAGKVVARQEGMSNPKLATGDIEVDCTGLTILNKAQTRRSCPTRATRSARSSV